MRILQVIPSVATSYGGPSIAVVAVHGALLAKGVDARLLSTDYAADDGRRLDEPQYDDLTRSGGVVLLPRRRPYRLKNATGLLRSLITEVVAADLVVVHGQYLLLNTLAPLVCRVLRTTYVMQPHGTFEAYGMAKATRIKLLYHATIGRLIVSGARKILVASESEARNSFVRIDHKTQIVPLGAELAAPEPIEGVRPSVEGRARRQCALFLGRLASVKRPDVVIDSWVQLSEGNDALLVMAGPDWDHTAASLARRAERLGVTGSVRFVGEVGAHHKSWLLAHAGVLLMPSENENFGMTVAEALAAGCLVVTTRTVGASVHVLACGGGLVIETPDVSQLVAAVREIEAWTADEVHEARARAVAYAAAHLSWPSVADRLLVLAD